MSDIFISYASEDRDRVQSLARALKRKGWSVWWDRRIPIGRSFDEVIQEALDALQSGGRLDQDIGEIVVGQE